MIGRLLLGVIKGLLLGGALLGAIVYGAHLSHLGALLAYPAAAITGALTGLIAGKAIWQRDAKIEAGLKSLVGALLGAAAWWAIARWVPIEALNTLATHAVPMPPGSNVLVLPLVAMLLGVIFELDNTPGDDARGGNAPGKKRVAALGSKRVSVADELGEAADAADDVAPPSRAKR